MLARMLRARSRRHRGPRTRRDRVSCSFSSLSSLVSLFGLPLAQLCTHTMSKSAHVSTSTAPAFPRVGDTFSSLNEFKLACHRAARAYGPSVLL